MTNPTIPSEFPGVTSAEVLIGRHVVAEKGSVILPCATLGECVAVGALSLGKGGRDPFSVYAGVPARRGDWSRELLEDDKPFLKAQGG